MAKSVFIFLFMLIFNINAGFCAQILTGEGAQNAISQNDVVAKNITEAKNDTLKGEVAAAAVILPPNKIQTLVFDNSDNFIFLNSIGSIDDAQVKKGVLTNPDRIYFDIPQSALLTPAITYELTNSALFEVSISQFSNNPFIARIVLKYDKTKIDAQSVKFETKFNQSYIKYQNNAFKNKAFENVYSYNSIDNFNPVTSKIKAKAQAEQAQGANELNVMFEKNSNKMVNDDIKLASNYFIHGVTRAKDGILIKGMGNFSIRPSMTLENPKRLVIDLENAILAQKLRNASFPIGSAMQNENNKQTLASRELLRLGQFDKNIVRLVIQGENCTDYRLIVSGDLQNIYITKRQNVLGTKLTNFNTNLIGFYSAKDSGVEVLGINFTSPVSFSTFEENKNFYLDIQNVGQFDENVFNEFVKNPYYQNLKMIKLADDKVRFQKPLGANVHPDLKISADGTKFKVYFREITPIERKEKITTEVTKIVEQRKAKPQILSKYYEVVIDAGHGGNDYGAMRENVREKDLNLELAKLLKKNLEREKIHVKMTRTTDKFLELESRVIFSEEENPTAFISIHHNASLNPSTYGIETHWYRDESRDFAKCVHSALASDKNVEKWNTINRGLFKSQFYVINHTTSPAILVEVGFISNENERNALKDKKRQEEIAKSISDGIVKYLKEGKK